MTGNTATFEVDGPAAHQIAKHLLSNLGMNPEAIEEGDVALDFNGEGHTTVSIDADGPLAGVILAQMVGGVAWDDHTATAIDASFREAEDDSPSAEAEWAEATEADDDESAGAFRPQVEPLVGKVDPATVQFPGESPGRIRENTKLHLVAALLLECYDTLDEEWLSFETLSGFAGDELDERQTQNGLSRLFVSKGMLVRRQRADAQGRAYEYHPTRQLREEVERLGDYDIEAVRENVQKHRRDDEAE